MPFYKVIMCYCSVWFPAIGGEHLSRPTQLQLQLPRPANMAIQLRCQAHEQLTPRMVSGTGPEAGIQLLLLSL